MVEEAVDRLYSLYGKEIERKIMARNREPFGFRVNDSPMVPDRKSGPVGGESLWETFSSLIIVGIIYIWG